MSLTKLSKAAKDALIEKVVTGEGGDKSAAVVLGRIRHRLDK